MILRAASRSPLPVLFLAVLAAAWFVPAEAPAGVVVMANRTTAPVAFAVQRADGKQQQLEIAAGDVLPLPVAERIGVAFTVDGQPRRYLIDANSIQYFLVVDGNLNLFHVPLKLPEPTAGAPAAAVVRPTAAPPADADQPVTIPVKLLVDEEEPTVQSYWERKLRARVAEASAIIERACRVRFEVVAVGTWKTNNAVSDFSRTLADFEREVDPRPARLAIGFTSQYQIPKGRTHMGGTRGALHTHILIREWSQHVSEPERLEILVHELGHYLGAVHSPELDSVMRAVLGDRQANARAFRIGFDPLNTFAMCLVADELRTRRLRSLQSATAQTRRYLQATYNVILPAIPNDPCVLHYLALVGGPAALPTEPVLPAGSLEAATQAVVRAVTEAAVENALRPQNLAPEAGGSLRADRLTELCVRRAAAAASQAPPEHSVKAFLLGLGIAMDPSSALAGVPGLAGFYGKIESDRQRRDRAAALGTAAMGGRRNLMQHFAISATLTAVVGAKPAEAVGLAKEFRDVEDGGSGFSFADLAADMAGVAFASAIREGRLSLAEVAESFAVADFLPATGDLPEDVGWDDFFKTYKSVDNDAFRKQQEAIRRRISELPGHTPPDRPAAAVPAATADQ